MDDTVYNIKDILAENEKRKAALAGDSYDPLSGVGCWGDRVEAAGCMVPRQVLARCPDYLSLSTVEQERQRIIDDFEFWCARCVTIKDKKTGRNVPLVLNRPQRRLLAALESQRVSGQLVRVILLKARQWGGSTLVQMYMAWMQLVRHTGWNSLICGNMHAASKNIKRMYNLLLRHYPRELLDEDAVVPRFSKLEGQPNVQQLVERDCLVITGTSRSEDAARGYDIAMAHLSEVAFWYNPDDVVRSVCGSVALKPETVIVLESTADGVGNYFHDEWLRAEQELSDKIPVFVPWYEIEMYAQEVEDPLALWQAMDDYEYELWNAGCTLEQINWYHHKRKEYRTHQHMMSEFPSSASEAFSTTGLCPFDRKLLDNLSLTCDMPPVLVGDIQGKGQEGLEAKQDIHLVRLENGRLKVWEQPERDAPVKTQYLVVVDVGGRADTSDYSVIAVWRVADSTRRAVIVAQWRGHIDHDMLGWKSMQLAIYYNNAALVIECNTLINEAARAGESEYILQKLNRVYGRLYKYGGKTLGFHTNVKTKRKAISALIEAVRDGKYIERDIGAVNEMCDYQEINCRYAARPGKHDDILMTRAIGILVMQEETFAGKKEPPPVASLTTDGWLATPVRR